MPYALGIDIGTTSTVDAVAHWRGTRWGPPDLVPLGDGSVEMPATLPLAVDGTVVRGFLHRVGDSVSLSVDGQPHRAADLTAQLVDQVVTRVETAYGEPPALLAVPVPAHWGGYQTGRLHAALTRIGLDQAHLPPAPAAAVEAHAGELALGTGATVAVYAFGATGCDCALLRREPDGFTVLASGSLPIGGADLDDVLVDRAREALTGRYPRAVWTTLRQRCAAARVELSTESSATIRVPVPGAPTVTVSCAEFEELILPLLTATADQLRAVLRAGPAPEAVVLAGGVTHTPLVRRLVESVASGQVLIGTAPEYTVALGAAQLVGAATGRRLTATREPVEPAVAIPAALPAVAATAGDDVDGEPPRLLYPPPRPPVLITELTAPRRRAGR